MKSVKVYSEQTVTGVLPGFGSYALESGVLYNGPDMMVQHLLKHGVSLATVEPPVLQAPDIVFSREEIELPAHSEVGPEEDDE